MMKKPMKSGKLWNVTFKVPRSMGSGYQQAYLAGDFNDWHCESCPMKRNRDGSFSLTLKLEPRQSYQFRYRLGQDMWVNDDMADGYVFSEFANCENSMVCL